MEYKVYILPKRTQNLVRFELIGDFFEVWSRAEWFELRQALDVLREYYGCLQEYENQARRERRTRNLALLQRERAKLDELAQTLLEVVTAYIHLRNIYGHSSLPRRYALVRRYVHNYLQGGRLHGSLARPFWQKTLVEADLASLEKKSKLPADSSVLP